MHFFNKTFNVYTTANKIEINQYFYEHFFNLNNFNNHNNISYLRKMQFTNKKIHESLET